VSEQETHMAKPNAPSRLRSRRRTETILLTLVLSVGVVGFEFVLHVVFAHAEGGLKHATRDILISVPVAVTAVWTGRWLASRFRLDGPRQGTVLSKAALISLVFMVMLIPSAGAHDAIDKFFDGSSADAAAHSDPDALLAGPGLIGQLLHGLTDALLGQAVGLPMLIAALLFLKHRSVERRPRSFRRTLRSSGMVRVGHVTAVTALVAGFVTMSPAGGAAFASARTVPAQDSISTSGPANPCDTAPHVTFDVSAINIKMVLNRFGVNDPHAFMYVLDQDIAAVRAQEASGQVSIGLHGDAIQPLVIRAHAGDCVTVNFTNRTTYGLAAMDEPPLPDPADGCNNGTAPPACDGSLATTAPENLAWNVDGLPGLTAADVSSAVGKNPDNTAAAGQTQSYTVYMDPALGEGAHLFHSTGDTRQTESHGLFGALVEEPAGSQWLDPGTLQPLASGWDAVIKTASNGGPSFREFTLLFHEIGDEGFRQIMEKDGTTELPVVDPFTQAYRPCSKAINYRSECFYERLLNLQNHGFLADESQQYGSYMNGDMATPMPQSYVGDPYKTRLVNAGSEMAHVYHEHGGAIRWRRNPGADNPDIAGGLEKVPEQDATSIRLDSQTIQPGESYDLEHECGAGGCQQAAGDYLFHCHIANHYIAGMLGFMRVFDTLQPDLPTVPGRVAKPQAVTSAGLIGRVVEGKTVVPRAQLTDPTTQTALESLVENQLPPQGVRLNAQDATVWNWVKGGTSAAPVYYGEPEDTTSWPDFTSPSPGVRPPIMFDPANGRYAWPLLSPHLGMRPPFAPNGHSGTPWLGPTTSSTHPDGLCPAGAPVHTYNITAIQVSIKETNGGLNPPQVDGDGQIFVLNEDKQAVESGAKQPVPLVLRSDVGDCLAITLTSELAETAENHQHSKVNMHTHFVQFDPQASDGVITGLSFEQSVNPDTTENRTLSTSVPAGTTRIAVTNVSALRPGISIEVGQGQVDTEIAKINAINGNTLYLARPLHNSHAAGESAGVEFVQYRWYSDVDAGTVFFHDHVDGIHSWGHGLFAAHIIEPAGSTFHDPSTGALIRSGPSADIWTNGSAGFGESGSFREFVLFQHTGLTGSGSPQGCEMASFNLRAAPLIDRDPNANNPANGPSPGNSVPDSVGNYTMGFTASQEPAGADRVDCTNVGTANDPYVFSSVAHGDPPTPLLRAYVGDPVVIRQVGLNERVGDLRITGHRFAAERFSPDGTLTDAGTTGISERFDYVLDGGAGGPAGLPGDYLYYSGRTNELDSGAWGIFRVMDTKHPDLEVLPGLTAPHSGPGFPRLTYTGKAPPAASGPGQACPSWAPVRNYDVSIFGPVSFDVGMPGELDKGVMYALTSDEAAIKAGTKPVVPLVIRAGQFECLQVNLHNDLPADNFTWTWGSGSTRAGFNIGNILSDPQGSYGAAIGYDPDSTVAPGGVRTYQYFVDQEVGTSLVLNLGNESTLINGGYGAVIAEPAFSDWTDPVTGGPLSSGVAADVHQPFTGTDFREFVTLFSDREPLLGHSIMIYYLDSDHSYINYNEQSLTQEEGSDLNAIPLWQAKSDTVNGGADPATPVFQAVAGDPVRFRFADAAGFNTINMGIAGHSFPLDHGMDGSQIIESRTLLPGETFDAYLVGGAGGATQAPGDYEYSVNRNPMIKSGDWGIFRVLPRSSRNIKPLTN
jgi:FtsP/CotA-like multicopper oxidase with cupredoxin domain